MYSYQKNWQNNHKNGTKQLKISCKIGLNVFYRKISGTLLFVNMSLRLFSTFQSSFRLWFLPVHKLVAFEYIINLNWIVLN